MSRRMPNKSFLLQPITSQLIDAEPTGH